MTSFVPLIEATRGGTLECIHFGAVALVDVQGHLLAAAGDAHWLSFTRSTLKALQALPFMEAGGPRQLGWGSEQVALLCASHNGEPMHTQRVEGMLASAGLGVRALQCGCHVPLYVELGVGPAPAQVSELHHNCSGKHAGFLAWCVQQGQPTSDYLNAGHPLQQAIRRTVAQVAGMEPEQLKAGTDGCSAPNYALPLSRLAQAYARLASGEQDTQFGASFAQLAAAMTAHPELVSGTHRNDEALMRVGRGDWVTKVGADGVQAVASKSRGQAFVLKIADGSKLAANAATIEVLDQLGWLDDGQREQLRPWRSEAILNARGAQVGERRAAFLLRGGRD